MFGITTNPLETRILLSALLGCLSACGDNALVPADASIDSTADADATVTPDVSVDAPIDAMVADATSGGCSATSLITAQSPDAGFAPVGSVFSSTPYLPGTANTHRPHEIIVEVTDAQGAPVPDCPVAWQPADGSGWVFPIDNVTDSDGLASAWWVAGPTARQELTARIDVDQGASAMIVGQAAPHSTRSNSIHLRYGVSGNYNGMRVEVTPITFPGTTYYAAIGTTGMYTGIQNTSNNDNPAVSEKIVIFSVLHTDGIDAEVVDSGAAMCTGFGGEGTGRKCLMNYDWQLGDTYRFELTIDYPVADRTDFRVDFVDVTNGAAPIHVATLRYGRTYPPDWAYGFVEDYVLMAPSCLLTHERSAYFHNIEQRSGTTWSPVRSAGFTAVYNPMNNEVCTNYYYGADGDRFLWSSGGSMRIGPPLLQMPSPTVMLP